MVVSCFCGVWSSSLVAAYWSVCPSSPVTSSSSSWSGLQSGLCFHLLSTDGVQLSWLVCFLWWLASCHVGQSVSFMLFSTSEFASLFSFSESCACSDFGPCELFTLSTVLLPFCVSCTEVTFSSYLCYFGTLLMFITLFWYLVLCYCNTFFFNFFGCVVGSSP